MNSVPQKTQGVSTFNWEDGSTTFDVTQMNAGQRFRCAISQATEAARRRFPHSTDRIERAHELVHAAKVVLHPRGRTATVRSSDDTKTYTVNGTCECPDASRAPEGWCKHRLAVAILRKALEIMQTFGTANGLVTLQAEKLPTEEEAAPELPVLEPVTATVQMPTCPEFQETVTAAAMEPVAVLEAEVVSSVPRIPSEFLYERKGVTAIRWGGLLHMAHEAGMCEMTVDVVTVSDTLAVMRATARFNDGGVWTDIGDATPQNVGKEMAPAFIRMASTRAQARCLRTALDIPYVCSAELSDD
jgi:hypothetical protein